MTRVLITGAGGAAATVLLKHLRGKVDLIAADIDPHAAGLYLVPEGCRALLPRGDDPNFGRALLELARRTNADVVIPTVDAELLPAAQLRREFAGALLLAPACTLSLCLDKLRLARFVAASAPAAQEWTSTLAPEWQFPIIAKPRSGSGGRGVVLLRTREEYDAYLPDDPDGTMIQEFLPGAEYSVDVFAAKDGHVVAAVPRERLKVDSGVAVACRTVHDNTLERMARSIAARVGLRGVANLQFRRGANGTPKLIEINPRFPGTLSLTIRAGVDIPQLCLDEWAGRTIPRWVQFRECTIVRTWEDTEVDAFVEAAPKRRSA
ncbi:MAG: ATP-grasp domain-containing protein [Myxococcota bacterium]